MQLFLFPSRPSLFASLLPLELLLTRCECQTPIPPMSAPAASSLLPFFLPSSLLARLIFRPPKSSPSFVANETIVGSQVETSGHRQTEKTFEKKPFREDSCLSHTRMRIRHLYFVLGKERFSYLRLLFSLFRPPPLGSSVN